MSQFRRRARWVMPVATLGVTLVLLVMAGPVAEALRGDLPRGEDPPGRWAAPDLVLPGGDVVPGGLVDLFDGLGRSLRDGGVGLERYWDAKRMMDEAAQFMPPGLARQLAGLPPARLRAEFRKLAPQFALRLAYQSHAIRDVRWVVPDAEGVVLVRHVQRGPDGVEYPVKMRWWVVRQPDGWRVYDTEEVVMGCRVSTLMGLSAGEVVGRADQPDLLRRLRDFAAAQNLVVTGEFAAARAALDRIDTADFPRAVRGLYHLARALVELNTEAFAATVREADQAEAHLPDLPAAAYLRACAHFALGQHDKVVPAGRAFVERAGPDGGLCSLLGQSLRELDRRAEAAAAFRQSLDDEPDNVEVLDWLRACLPPDAKADLGDRLLALAEPRKHLGRLVSAALADKDVPAAEAFVAAFREAHPEAAEGFIQDVHVCHQKKDLGQALAVVREAFAAVPADQHKEVIKGVAWVFANAGQAMAIYEAAPPGQRAEAFDALAGVTFWSRVGFDSPDDAFAFVAGLIDRHARDHPEDRKLPVYRGHLAAQRDRRDEAEKHFAKAMDLADDAERAAIRSARVNNLLQAGRAADAYATVPPAEATFAQIAEYLLWKDGAGLEPILARHRQAHPEDPFLPVAEGRLRYAQRRWARALPFLRTVADRPADPKDRFAYNQRVCGEKVVRCLANLGRLDDARDALARHKERFENSPPQLDLLIEAMDGNVEAVEREVTLHLLQGWPPEVFTDDHDLGPLLRTPGFERLRAMLPEAWDRR